MHYNVQRIFSSKKIENGIKRPLPGPTMWFLRSYALTRTEKTGGERLEKDEFSAFSGGQHVQNIIGDEVYVLGLAGDYCVKQTLLDLLEYVPQKTLYAITDLIYSVDGTHYGPIDYFDGKVIFVESKDL